MDNRDYPSKDFVKLLRLSNIDCTDLRWVRPVTMTDCAPRRAAIAVEVARLSTGNLERVRGLSLAEQRG
jgi:hypothetical protein